MIQKETIQQYFEQELENFGRLTILLYRDMKLLKDGDMVTFAEELINRSKKTYIATILMTIAFFIIGIVQLFDSIFDSGSIYIGMLYLTGGFLGLHFATKEYYKIYGSMKLLIKLARNFELKENMNKS